MPDGEWWGLLVSWRDLSKAILGAGWLFHSYPMALSCWSKLAGRCSGRLSRPHRVVEHVSPQQSLGGRIGAEVLANAQGVHDEPACAEVPDPDVQPGAMSPPLVAPPRSHVASNR